MWSCTLVGVCDTCPSTKVTTSLPRISLSLSHCHSFSHSLFFSLSLSVTHAHYFFTKITLSLPHPPIYYTLITTPTPPHHLYNTPLAYPLTTILSITTFPSISQPPLHHHLPMYLYHTPTSISQPSHLPLP